MNVRASGSVLTESDKSAMRAVVDSGWITAGPVNAKFEQRLSDFTGIKHVRTCNSGSSANLLAVATMVESGRWKPKDLIVTVAASFPTTVNPLLLYGLTPMFVDVDLDTLNANIDQVSRAVNAHQVKGVILAHTLGNPFDVAKIAEMCRKRGIWLVEDCCDALGATFHGKHVGQFSSIATCSFFPAHHITTGEGGAVFTNDEELAAVASSIRDWGRDCFCAPGDNNTCGMRFSQQFGELPYGYDHKYVMSRLGYNLKLTDLQAACGLSQIDRLPDFVAARRDNFDFLAERFDSLPVKLVDEVLGARASWFGFPFTLKETGIRVELQSYLAEKGVDSRLVFAGNITKQPYFKKQKYILAAAMMNTDTVMKDTLWIGCHPALSKEQLDYAYACVKGFLDA